MQLQPVASRHVRASLPALPPQASPYLFTQGNKPHIRRTGPLFPAASCLSPAAAAATPPVLIRATWPNCGHAGATTATLPRILICSQCGHGAFIKSGRPTRSPSLTRDERGGHARGVGARHAERRGNLPTDLAVAAAGVCNVRYAAHFRVSVDMTLGRRSAIADMNRGIGPYTFARASSRGGCIGPKCGMPHRTAASCSLHRHSRIEHHMDEVPALPQEDWIVALRSAECRARRCRLGQLEPKGLPSIVAVAAERK